MTSRSLRALVVPLSGILAAGMPAAAGEAGADRASPEQIQRLEALYQSQQHELQRLQRLVTASSGQDMDAARVDAMKRQIREVLSEREFRESLMPSSVMAGYDNGFYIGSSDELFRMRINGLFQFRFAHYGTRSDNRYRLPRLERDDRTGFDVQRLRLTFSGNVYSKDLTYSLTMRSDATDNYDMRIHVAYVNYKFADEFQMRAGIFRLASTRQQMQSDQNFQFIDRPMVDAVFGLGISTGVRFWGQLLDKRVEYYIDVANSLNSPDNLTITPDPADMDSNPAILAKAVWHALGDEPGKEFAIDADLPRRQNPALDIGMHYAFNEDDGDRRTLRIPFPQPRSPRGVGGFGLTNTNGLQIHQFGFESAFKYQGFSLSGEYILRIVDVRNGDGLPLAPWYLLTGDRSTTVQHGAYVQAGYFLPIPGCEDQFELVARVGGISALAEQREGSWEYTGGLNYYIQGNKVKLTTEVTRVYEVPISNAASGLANVNDDALLFRMQLQVSF